jgi:AraC-like DNA-binding protein
MRELSPLVARACARLSGVPGSQDVGESNLAWEEIAIQIGSLAVLLGSLGSGTPADPLPSTAARITRAVRMVDDAQESELTVQRLAGEAGLSPYHFLRTFEQVTGVTPHQYIRRARLQRAAAELLAERGNVLNIALDCGFGDVSNFNRAFRSEFGRSPREFRRQGLRADALVESRCA